MIISTGNIIVLKFFSTYKYLFEKIFLKMLIVLEIMSSSR